MEIDLIELAYLVQWELFGLKNKSEIKDTWKKVDTLVIDRALTPFEQIMVSKNASNLRVCRIANIIKGKDIQKIFIKNFQLLRSLSSIALPACLKDISEVDFTGFDQLKEVALPEIMHRKGIFERINLPASCAVYRSGDVEIDVAREHIELLSQKERECNIGQVRCEDFILKKMISDRERSECVAIDVFSRKAIYEIIRRFLGAGSDRARYAERYVAEDVLIQTMRLRVGVTDGEGLEDTISRGLSECTDYKLNIPSEAFLPDIRLSVQNAKKTRRAFCLWLEGVGGKVADEAKKMIKKYKEMPANPIVLDRIKEIRFLKETMGKNPYSPEEVLSIIERGKERIMDTPESFSKCKNYAVEGMHMASYIKSSYEADCLSERLISDDHFEEIASLQNDLLEMSGVKIVARSSGKSTFEIDNLGNMNKRNNARNREVGQRNGVLVNRAQLEQNHSRSRLGGRDSTTNGDRMLNLEGRSDRRRGGRRV